LLVLLAGVALVALLRPRREQVAGHAFAVPSAERRIVVEVLNGTKRQGLARVATRMLRRQGIDVVFLGNADTTFNATRILVRRDEPTRGKRVAEVLGMGQLVIQRDTLRRVDVSVILGDDFRPATELRP
jgi:calcineurin-like phosphoesterase